MKVAWNQVSNTHNITHLCIDIYNIRFVNEMFLHCVDTAANTLMYCHGVLHFLFWNCWSSWLPRHGSSKVSTTLIIFQSSILTWGLFSMPKQRWRIHYKDAGCFPLPVAVATRNISWGYLSINLCIIWLLGGRTSPWFHRLYRGYLRWGFDRFQWFLGANPVVILFQGGGFKHVLCSPTRVAFFVSDGRGSNW